MPLDVASFQKENLKPVQTVEGTGRGHTLSMEVSIFYGDSKSEFDLLVERQTLWCGKVEEGGNEGKVNFKPGGGNHQGRKLRSGQVEQGRRGREVGLAHWWRFAYFHDLFILILSFSDIKREKTIVNITSFDKESLKKTETVEKMALPTADDIQAEK